MSINRTKTNNPEIKLLKNIKNDNINSNNSIIQSIKTFPIPLKDHIIQKSKRTLAQWTKIANKY